MSTIHEKTVDEARAVADAKRVLRARIADIQGACDHPVILKHTDSSYDTWRVCEECGYYERVRWDSSYKYKDQRLVKRAYSVSWSEMAQARA